MKVWALCQQNCLIEIRRAGVETYRCVQPPGVLASLKSHQVQQTDSCALEEERPNGRAIQQQPAVGGVETTCCPCPSAEELWPGDWETWALGELGGRGQVSWCPKVFLYSGGMGLDSSVVLPPSPYDSQEPVLRLGVVTDVPQGLWKSGDACVFHLEKWGQLLSKLRGALRVPYLDSVVGITLLGRGHLGLRILRFFYRRWSCLYWGGAKSWYLPFYYQWLCFSFHSHGLYLAISQVFWKIWLALKRQVQEMLFSVFFHSPTSLLVEQHKTTGFYVPLGSCCLSDVFLSPSSSFWPPSPTILALLWGGLYLCGSSAAAGLWWGHACCLGTCFP